ncbi:MAG: hypothetical protein UZ03_NOB001002693 [Nitrospira sp. OLB3]|nr:MAG: hypothetical protein UZ03_NOB001002693 [Nitrospira sp. OLB3]
MSLYPLIHLGKIFQRIVRRVDGVAAKEPENGNFFGMLVNDAADDSLHSATLQKPIYLSNGFPFLFTRFKTSLLLFLTLNIPS